MIAPKIVMDFAGDGTVKVDGQGFEGADCDKAMKFVEEALGEQVARQNKAEYHKKPPVRVRQ